jgi:hypothetical protein
MCSLLDLFDHEEDGHTLIWSRSRKQNGGSTDSTLHK